MALPAHSSDALSTPSIQASLNAILADLEHLHQQLVEGRPDVGVVDGVIERMADLGDVLDERRAG